MMTTPGTLKRVSLLEDLSLHGREFCVTYTGEVDAWLSLVFTAALLEEGRGSASHEGAIPPTAASAGPALVALGGHGRSELCPQSDLDLLLLVPKKYDAAALAERIWYPIWDAGLKLGHSVRTLRDTLALASDDLETATALLSVRHIAGNAALSAELSEKARAAWRRNGRKWIEVLAKSVNERHAKEGEIAFTLEPDLKEGRGGLRDVHALDWAAMAGAEVDEQILESVRGDYETLLEARVELHRATERHSDRLLLQEQSEVARRLGDVDADALMSRVAGAARSIAWTSDEAWFDIDVATSARSGAAAIWGRGNKQGLADQDLGDGIVLRDRRVRLLDETNPITDGHMVLRVALQAAASGTRISAATLKLMADAPALTEPWDETARQLFCDLLLTGDASIEVVEALDRAGAWEKFLREWRNVRGLFQRNALHKFTVDRHLLEASARAAALADRTPRPDLLVVGALLHDIGKGYPGDHSATGEFLASGIARRMGFTPGESATIGFLAKWHLLLSDTARRRDLGDPATVQYVADKVGSPEQLALLHALSEADALATGPGVWTSWTETLVYRLVTSVGDVINAGARSESTVDAPPRTLDPSSPTTRPIAPVVPASVDRSSLPLVTGEGDWVVVVCDDRSGVICRVAGVLALHGLNVVEATVESDGEVAVDRFRVQSRTSRAANWDKVAEDVERALNGRLAIRARLAEREQSQRRRYQPGLSQFDTGVTFDDELATGATMIEVVGLDRAGLLYELTNAFGELDVDIRSAKIHTMGVDVIDTFYVTDRDGQPIVDPAFRNEIWRSLQFVLHSGE